MFSRIVTLLAGALVSAIVLRWKNDSDANRAPWRPELDDLHKKLIGHLDERDAGLAARIAEIQPRVEALAAGINLTPDVRIDELAGRITQLQPKIEALATGLARPDPRVEAIAVRLTAVESKAVVTEEKVVALEQKVCSQDQRLQATNRVVIAIEQLLTTKIAEFDQRMETQGRSLQAMNSSIAQSDELLERVLDLVQNLSPAPESRESISTAPTGSEIRELQL